MNSLKKYLPLILGGVAMTVAMVEPALAAKVDVAAGTGVSGSAFDSYAQTVVDWAQGPLGIGLSVTMMLLGAGIGVAKNSPMPALSGVGGAAFLTWGPQIISDMMTNGAMLPAVVAPATPLIGF